MYTFRAFNLIKLTLNSLEEFEHSIRNILWMVLSLGVRGRLEAFSKTTGSITSLSGLCDCLSSTRGQMRCIEDQGFEPMNPNRAVWCSMDEVRFAETIGRSNLVDLAKNTSRIRNPALVA